MRSHASSWPAEIEMSGFSYGSIVGFWDDPFSDHGVDMERFRDWLKKQKTQSRQPYEQLGNALQKTGYADDAAKILYDGREAEREHACKDKQLRNCLWLTALSGFVGYGYRTHLAFWWVGAFVMLGAFVLHTTNAPRKYKLGSGAAYSFDMLLPVVKLNKKHDDVVISGWQQYYFYGHKLMGYVLALFVAAALGGLTK